MIRRFATVFALLLVVAACGSADSEPAAGAGEASTPDTQPPASQPADPQPGDTQPADTQPPADPGNEEEPSAPVAGSGEGTATVTLENGEVFEFGISCVLDPAAVGDTEFEFYFVSYDDPLNLDVSQFTEAEFNGAASISLFDSTTYEAVWEANSYYGSEVELTLNDNTVTGSAVFLPGIDAQGPGVRGELVANC